MYSEYWLLEAQYLWYFVPLSSYEQQGNKKKRQLLELRAAIIGIHGVNSSEWFPIIQSTSGYIVSEDGTMVQTYIKWVSEFHFNYIFILYIHHTYIYKQNNKFWNDKFD